MKTSEFPPSGLAPSLREEGYRFGDYRMDAWRRALALAGEPVPLPPKAFDTLLALVRRAGEVVDKDTLMNLVWPGAYVDENNLSQCVAALRRVLQDRRGSNRYIETVQGRGYRFVAEVAPADVVQRMAAAGVGVAVLPFENLSGDPGRGYLADGLTEELIAALGQIDPTRIGVAGRSAVQGYRGVADGPVRAGRELGSAYVVEGSIRAEGGRLRVTANLVRTEDSIVVWSESYDSEPASILAFQRELADAVARQVRLHLDPVRVDALRFRQPRTGDALDWYLRGRHLYHQLTPATTRQALECYARATALDPDYALAWSGIADALCTRPITGDADPRELIGPAREASDRALRAQPGLAEAHASVGFRQFWLDWDWPAAEQAFRAAIGLDPGNAFAHRMLGLVISHRGRVAEALASLRRARELDPLVPAHQALSAQGAYAARDFELAQRFARQALVLDPAFWVGHFHLAQSSLATGDVETAWRAIDEGAVASGGNSKFAALRGYLHALGGRPDESRRTLDALAAHAEERYVPPCAFALIHVGLGELEAAADWIERAAEARDVHLMFIPVDAKWDEARKHPRIDAVLRRIGFLPLAGDA